MESFDKEQLEIEKYRQIEVALFNSLYENNTSENLQKINDEQKQFIIQHLTTKNADLIVPNGAAVNYTTVGGGGNIATAQPFVIGANAGVNRSRFDSGDVVSLAEESLGTNSIHSTRMDALRQLSTNNSQAENSRLAAASASSGGGDAALDDATSMEMWQKYTIECMQREKTGPKKTLPVLTSSNLDTSNRKRFTGGRARRWGGEGRILFYRSSSVCHSLC